MEAIQHYIQKEKPENVSEILAVIPELAENALTYQLTEPKVSFAQIMLGRMFASKFGLKSGDDVSDVLRQGENFFRRRLMAEMRIPTAANFRMLYDIQMHTNNGDNFFVTIGNTSENLARWKNFSNLSSKLKIVNGILYYNGDRMCSADGIEVATYSDENGNEYNMIYCRDNQALQILKGSEIFDFIRYKYTKNNTRFLLRDQYYYNLEEQDGKILVKKPIIFNGNVVLEEGIDINYELDENTINLLNGLSSNAIKKKLNRLTKDKFEAFKKSLHMIGARIPSQSMQSFSGVEVVNFTDSSENEVYLPRTLTWIAGSDYDIDKFYLMAWSILDNGTLPFYKKVAGFSIDDLNTLPMPNNVQFEYNVITPDEEIDPNSVVITEQEALAYSNGDIVPLRKILESGTNQITFVINAVRNPDGTTTIANGDQTLQALADLWNDANDYNASSKNQIHRMKSQSEHIFKNKVVHYLQEALKDVSIQMNLLTALNMDAADEIIEQNQAAADDERTMTADNPMSIMRQQYNNMVGRAGIGAVAVSQKAFSTVSYAINYQLKEFNTRLLNSQSQEEDIRILQELNNYLQSISFEGKLKDKSLRTLANINLRPVISTLQAKLANSQYAEMLQNNSNRTNAYDLYSNIMSYATDNAKELKLDKLNAVGPFIDYYCYLFATGEDFTEAGKFMTSPVMSLVRKYLKTNIFEIGSDRIRMKHVIDFITDSNDLPIINSKLFQSSLVDAGFLDAIEKNSNFANAFTEMVQKALDIKVGNVKANQDQLFKILKRYKGIAFTTSVADGVLQTASDDGNLSGHLVPIMRQAFRSIPEFGNFYLRWLSTKINSAKD
jgi:ABC-type histidine transport system ATPase subunit